MEKNICLIHGWGASSQKLKPLEDRLIELGWRVLNVKLPFFELPEPARPWQLTDFVNFSLQKANNHFRGKPYFFFGHSLGGRLALKAALKNQDNLQGIVLCAAAGVSRPSPVKRLFFMLIAKIFAPLNNVAPNLFFLPRRLLYRLAGASDYLKITSAVKKETFRNIIAEDLRPEVDDITLPALILWGQKDRTTPPKDASFLKRRLNNATLIVFPNDNHRLPYDQPAKIANKINQWFKTLS